MHDARENEGGGEGCHVSARRPTSTQTDTVPTSRVMCPANPFDDFGNSGASASCSFFHLPTRSRIEFAYRKVQNISRVTSRVPFNAAVFRKFERMYGMCRCNEIRKRQCPIPFGKLLLVKEEVDLLRKIDLKLIQINDNEHKKYPWVQSPVTQEILSLIRNNHFIRCFFWMLCQKNRGSLLTGLPMKTELCTSRLRAACSWKKEPKNAWCEDGLPGILQNH
ncbi:hypothetical protein G5I_06587 [Acromyrmex echinatior]|uniref:Uncharacterized protein n=1 Tax=Acromyrmex echinatior TaxID=103372 RepID=F4WLG0_ACREC|nr:hypothetical protein G5I_06587 [Acromyrmex echinatior]